MVSPSTIWGPTRANLYSCARCAVRASKPDSLSKRWITGEKRAKEATAGREWAQKASRIRAGEEKSMLAKLEERGLVKTITGDRETLERYMTDKRIGAYVGIDPTAASLHVGHLLPLMCLFWMYVNGYNTVSLLGGATATIGDPTDRLTSRTLDPDSIRTANVTKMHSQLKKLWRNAPAYGEKYGYKWEPAWQCELVNNNAWWEKLPMLKVLQLLGPGMRMGSMLARETVKNKMSKGDGMSYAEFTYPLMQAWDWWHMFHTQGVQMQIGGSDQYGNITAGIDAIKYISANHPDPAIRDVARAMGEPIGFTVPLLTTSSGQKFGKSAGNAVWLDPDLTSSFDLYGFFLQTSDADVTKYLKLFTFMPLPEIDGLLETHRSNPSRRWAQHKLAQEFVELVHGRQAACDAERQHSLLFQKSHSKGQDTTKPTIDVSAQGDTMRITEKPRSNVTLPQSLIAHGDIGKILFAAEVADTRSAAYRLVDSGGAYIGGPRTQREDSTPDGHVTWTKIQKWLPEDTGKFLIHDDLLFFRRAKRHIKIVKVVPDEEYVVSGSGYPGISQSWRRDVLKAMAVKDSITQSERDEIERLVKEAEKALEESQEARV